MDKPQEPASTEVAIAPDSSMEPVGYYRKVYFPPNSAGKGNFAGTMYSESPMKMDLPFEPCYSAEQLATLGNECDRLRGVAEVLQARLDDALDGTTFTNMFNAYRLQLATLQAEVEKWKAIAGSRGSDVIDAVNCCESVQAENEKLRGDMDELLKAANSCFSAGWRTMDERYLDLQDIVAKIEGEKQ